MFSALAEFERDLIRERTDAGLKATRARGRLGGRPSLLDNRQICTMSRKIPLRRSGRYMKLAGHHFIITSSNKSRSIKIKRRIVSKF